MFVLPYILMSFCSDIAFLSPAGALSPRAGPSSAASFSHAPAGRSFAKAFFRTITMAMFMAVPVTTQEIG